MRAQKFFGLLLCLPLQVLALPASDWLSPRLREHPLAGVIVDGMGKQVSEEALSDALATATFALIGEKHDNPDHHSIELRMLKQRLVSRPGSAVVFEMLDDAQLDGIAKLAVDDDLLAIKNKLEWPAKGWDFEVYGPLFQASVRQGKLVAGNIGKAFIGQLYQQGDVFLSADARYATVSTAGAATRQHFLDRIFDAHCGMQARESLTPMLSIQLAKDASMASAMASHTPALLIAGGEHVNAEHGVPSHLKTRSPDASTVIIELMEVAEGKFDAASYLNDSSRADFYWFTPATEQKDYCAGVTGRAAK